MMRDCLASRALPARPRSTSLPAFPSGPAPSLQPDSPSEFFTLSFSGPLQSPPPPPSPSSLQSVNGTRSTNAHQPICAYISHRAPSERSTRLPTTTVDSNQSENYPINYIHSHSYSHSQYSHRHCRHCCCTRRTSLAPILSSPVYPNFSLPDCSPAIAASASGSTDEKPASEDHQADQTCLTTAYPHSPRPRRRPSPLCLDHPPQDRIEFRHLSVSAIIDTPLNTCTLPPTAGLTTVSDSIRSVSAFDDHHPHTNTPPCQLKTSHPTTLPCHISPEPAPPRPLPPIPHSIKRPPRTKQNSKASCDLRQLTQAFGPFPPSQQAHHHHLSSDSIDSSSTDEQPSQPEKLLGNHPSPTTTGAQESSGVGFEASEYREYDTDSDSQADELEDSVVIRTDAAQSACELSSEPDYSGPEPEPDRYRDRYPDGCSVGSRESWGLMSSTRSDARSIMSHHTFGLPASSVPGSTVPPPLPSLSGLSQHPEHQPGKTSTTPRPAAKLKPTPAVVHRLKQTPTRPSTAPASPSPTTQSYPHPRPLPNPLPNPLPLPNPPVPAQLPALPPLPAILSHAPTRSDLLQYLLHHQNHHSLSQLILLLDLIAVVRGHAAQTWSFNDSLPLPPSTCPPTIPPSRCSLSPNISKPQSPSPSPIHRRLYHSLRPGTSDGLAPSCLSPPRPSKLLSPLSHSSPASRLCNLPNSHQHPSPPHSPEPSCSQTSWATHLAELYSPPQSDLARGWFAAMPLPKDSQTLQLLRKALPQPGEMGISLGVSPLKQVGHAGCEELAQSQPVMDWWNQHGNTWWPKCASSRCESFADVLALWPSLHFPTPALSQLYKVSNILSKSRAKLRGSDSPPHTILDTKPLLCRAALRGVLEVYLGRPSSAQLAAIEQLYPFIESVHRGCAKSQTQQSPTYSFTHSPSTVSVSQPSTPEHSLEDESQSLDLAGPMTHMNHMRTQKLRRFFGQEFDLISPTAPHVHLSASQLSFRAGPDPAAPLVSPVVNNRRKSVSVESEDTDRPRKRSTTVTTDETLASLASAEPGWTIAPTHFVPSELKSSHPRMTVVGTSPTSTPTFASIGRLQNAHGSEMEVILKEAEYVYDEPPVDELSSLTTTTTTSSTSMMGSQGFESTASEWESAKEMDRQTVKRLTKLERTLGEPFDQLMGFVGLGVKVVTEVVEDVQQGAVMDGLDPLERPCAERRAGQQAHQPEVRATSSHDMSVGLQSQLLWPSGESRRAEMASRTPRRPQTAQAEMRPDASESLSSPTAKVAVKRRLGKLQRFLDEVSSSSHGRHASAEAYVSGSSHARLNARRASEGKTVEQSMGAVVGVKEVKKRGSRFKLSGTGIKVEAMGRSSGETSDGRPTSRVSGHHERNASRSTSGNGWTSASSSGGPAVAGRVSAVPLGSVPMSAQYSSRSARKLEKLFGEHLPQGSVKVSHSSEDSKGEGQIIDRGLIEAFGLEKRDEKSNGGKEGEGEAELEEWWAGWEYRKSIEMLNSYCVQECSRQQNEQEARSKRRDDEGGRGMEDGGVEKGKTRGQMGCVSNGEGVRVVRNGIEEDEGVVRTGAAGGETANKDLFESTLREIEFVIRGDERLGRSEKLTILEVCQQLRVDRHVQAHHHHHQLQ